MQALRRDVRSAREETRVVVTYFTQLLSARVRNEHFQTLKARVDRLHPTTFIAVGDLAAHTLFLIVRRVRRHVGIEMAANENRNRAR